MEPSANFRTDLLLRLAEAEKRRTAAAKELHLSTQEISGLRQLIEIENQRLGEHHLPLLEGALNEAPTELPAFIRSIAKNRPVSKMEIVQHALPRGYFPKKDVSPGRVVHFTVVNMLNRGELKEVGAGKYVAS